MNISKMNGDNLKKESLEAKLDEVNIPKPEELVRKATGMSQAYGLLFAEFNRIMYAPFKKKKNPNETLEIKKKLLIQETSSDFFIEALLSTQKEVYYNTDQAITIHNDEIWIDEDGYAEEMGDSTNARVDSLFEDKSYIGMFYGRALTFFDNVVIQSGQDGIEDILNEKFEDNKGYYIHLSNMKNTTIRKINSLCVYDGKLYTLVNYYNKEHGVVELVKKDYGLGLGKEVRHYDVKHNNSWQGFFLPDGKFLSSVHLDFLDLDDEKIKGTDKHAGIIHKVVLLDYKKDYADVAYSGDFKEIEFARIDLKNCKAETKILISGPNNNYAPLDVVRSRKMDDALKLWHRGLKRIKNT